MRKLSLIIAITILGLQLFSQSPHGDELTIACEDCHNPKGWTMEKGSYTFTHDVTKFQIKCQHKKLRCLECHS